MYLNKCILFGNLTRDPELKALPSGQNVCNFGIATNRTFKDRDGAKKEQTEFHNIVVFGKQADSVSDYLRKGSLVYIEGRLQTRSWDQNGEKKYRTEIIAEIVQFGPRTSGSTGGSRRDRDDGPDTNDTTQYPASVDDINPDDIPF